MRSQHKDRTEQDNEDVSTRIVARSLATTLSDPNARTPGFLYMGPATPAIIRCTLNVGMPIRKPTNRDPDNTAMLL